MTIRTLAGVAAAVGVGAVLYRKLLRQPVLTWGATPEEAARQAVENDVHIIGVSSLAAGHLTLVPELTAALKKEGRGDIMIVVGGVIPPADYDTLFRAGAQAVFGPGTKIPEAAADLLEKLNAALGFGPKAAAE